MGAAPSAGHASPSRKGTCRSDPSVGPCVYSSNVLQRILRGLTVSDNSVPFRPRNCHPGFSRRTDVPGGRDVEVRVPRLGGSSALRTVHPWCGAGGVRALRQVDCRTPAEFAAAYDAENYVPLTTNIHGKT